MMASLIALNAFAIDSMLPALGDIGRHFSVPNENDQQLVVFAYILGFGLPQLVFGPLSDRYGRKGLLQFSLVGFTVMSFACMFAPSFKALLIIRFAQGVFAAGARVIAGAIVRDLMAGRAMAKVMSLIMTVFMIVPILAPAAGTFIMYIADWNWTFGVLGLVGGLTFIWTQFRLPNTLPKENRRPLNFNSVFQAYKAVMTTRVTCGYMLGSGVIFGALFAFIGASEQVFDQVFGVGENFWIWFAIIAGGLGVATFYNARIVERIGMRKISHTMLLLFVAFSVLNLSVMQIFGPVFWAFLPLFTLTFACFGMIGANFSALALEPLGHISGTANAAYGFATSTVSSLIGLTVARQFDGTVIPILIGFVVLGTTSLIVILIAERGRLFEVGSRAE